LEQEVIEHTTRLLGSDESLLLRELSHRINNDLTCIICEASVKAMQSDSVVVKAALFDVVDLLRECADVHQALRVPDQGRLVNAASYLRQLYVSMAKYRMNRLGINVFFSADDLRLEAERCWKLGLIVSELLTNVARHAQFEGRLPEARVKLTLAGNVVQCGVSDNGAAPELVRRARGLTIVAELVSSLAGRVHTSCAAEGYSFLLTFALTEAEQSAAGAIRAVQLKRRKVRRPQRLEAST
jgi:two-component sensor histidine kinase